MARKNGQQQQESKTGNAAGLPANGTGGTGLEQLTPADLIIPRLTLIQPTSQVDGVEAGKFYMNLTGDEYSEVEVVFLKVMKGRIYFAEDGADRKALCGSADRVKPSPRFQPPMAPVCAECSSARWDGKEPPDCSETFNLLGVTVESGLPFWWTVKSTAIAPTRRFLSAIALRAHLGKNLFDAQVLMKSQLVTLPGKKFHKPMYSITWLKDSSPYRDLYSRYAKEEIERTFMAEEAMGTADGNGFDWKTGQPGK
jgi:hypothetical protein